MHVCAIASARATIGGPSFELRTPSRNASFHRRTRLPPAWTPRALDASLGSASDAAPAPAATRNCRRESDCSRADEGDLLRPQEIEPQTKKSRLHASLSCDVIRPALGRHCRAGLGNAEAHRLQEIRPLFLRSAGRDIRARTHAGGVSRRKAPYRKHAAEPGSRSEPESARFPALLQSPLPDSNRRPLLTMELPARS